ncbi:MAG: hypothetical protein ABW321_14965 [Polyangiales bacterium]
MGEALGTSIDTSGGMTSAFFHEHHLGARSPRGVTFLTICLAIALFMAVLVFARTAYACPSCAEGIQARSDVLSDGFGQNLLIAVLPFVLIGGICLRAEEVGRSAARRQRCHLAVSSDTTQM